ncbi:MAG TPA: glycosyltransferase, partial [Bacteroidales bacterium]|nr:glycosyltransferase [Bacteroidales bacterium]
AHYSFSAFCASLAGAKPLVVTLMGSDVKANFLNKYLIRFFAFFYHWQHLIVQSEDMKKTLSMRKVRIIPNGIDLHMFVPIDKRKCQEQLGWDVEKTHILFPSNPIRYVKNHELFLKTIILLNDTSLEIHYFENVPHKQTPIWYNAADLVILTSLWEGSPNAIKEAMACDRPIVATNVGDIKVLFGNEDGFYITEFDICNCARKIEQALVFANEKKHTKGRERLIALKIDDVSIAKRIYNLYDNIINKSNENIYRHKPSRPRTLF